MNNRIPDQNALVSVQNIMASMYIRYTSLNQEIYYMFKGSKSTELNLYLDLYGATKTIFSNTFRTDTKNYTEYTSAVINMCAHYRAFFRGLGVNTKIYIIFSYNTPDINMKIFPDYNKKYYEKQKDKVIKDMIDFNVKLLEIICPYLPQIYFIPTSFESTVMINHLMGLEKNKDIPSLIISKDIYPMQLVSLHPNTAYSKPTKVNGIDLHNCVSPRETPQFKEDFWRVFSNVRKIDMNRITIHPINFPLLCAMNKFPERSIPLFTNITKANQDIYSIVGEAALGISVDTLVNTTGKTEYQVIRNRYNVLDVMFMNRPFMDSIEANMVYTLLDDYYDPDALSAICSEYFHDNPIDLQRL